MILALVLAAAASAAPLALPSDFTPEENAAFAAEVGKLDLPNASFTLVTTQSQQKGVPRTSEAQVWWSKKKGHIKHLGKSAPELFIDLAKKTLVVVDHATHEAVRFPFAGRPGEHIVRDALQAMSGGAGFTRAGKETVAGKECEVFEGERDVATPVGAKIKSKERRCMWKGLPLKWKVEREAIKVKMGGNEIAIPATILEGEIKDLKLGAAKPADLDVPRGTKIKAAEEMLVKPPSKEELEKHLEEAPPPGKGAPPHH